MPQFKYFGAAHTEIFGYSEREACIHCGRVAPATLLKGEPATPVEFCCLECLAVGGSRIGHDTEIGYAAEGRLSTFDDVSLEMVPIEMPAGFRLDSLEELSRTPDFESHQGREFLVHCNDFMRYLGRWEPEDFADANGKPSKEVYVTVAENDSELWDATEREKAQSEDDWPAYEDSGWAYGAWCYVFECLHCGIRRCTWDCD